MLHRAIECGLSAADFENMTIGMIVDFLITCNNEYYDEKKRQKEEPKRYATADDIAAF